MSREAGHPGAGGALPPTYVPLTDRPWRPVMGLRPLDPDRWLEVDGRRGAELAEKQRLLATVPGTVFAALPGSEPAGADVLDAVVAWLGAHRPDTLRRHDDGSVEELGTRQVLRPGALHPLDAAARLVQEDLCLMERRDGVWVLGAASVCFPSRWHLPAKLGRDLSAIHAPVPGYETSLARPTAAFFDRLGPDRPVWRLNWTLIDSPALHQPDPGDRRRAPPADPGTGLWFRVERQTLRRLNERPAVVFTIRTYVTALAELVAAHPGAAETLAATLPTVPDETVAYKGWAGVVGPLTAWLAEHRGAGRLG